MRIAIQLSGQPRFTQDFNLFLENLIGYDQADWFIYLSNKYHTHRIKEGVAISPSWEDFDADWAINKISSNLPKNNFIQRFEISDSHLQQWPPVSNIHCTFSVEGVWMMYYNLLKVNQLRKDFQKQQNVEYDFILRVRSDSNLNGPIDVSRLNINHDEIYMPNNNWFGFPGLEVNDQFAIGKDQAVTTYCDIVHSIKKYNDSGIAFHPETLLAKHLLANNIKTIKADFESYIRQFPIDPKWN
jgi:hypothetical protein